MSPIPTQRGNPYQLVRWQHLFPKRSISRFCNETGVVDLDMFQIGKKRSAKPSDRIFCTERSWNEQAENGYGKYIEDEFQKVVERLLLDNSPVRSSDNIAITKFYSLWNVRHHWAKIHINEEPLEGLTLPWSPTVNEQERLEKAHISYMSNGPTGPIFSARQTCGMLIQANLSSWLKALANVQWGLLSSLEGEFIVPDNFSKSLIVPVTPNAVLVGNCQSMQISALDTHRINMDAMDNAESYCFARNLEKCRGSGYFNNSGH
jgi:hypothetical protein